MGHVVAALGALVLFISLFLNWYEPEVSAWALFELTDIVLAAIAAVALVAAAQDLFGESRAPVDAERWLPALGAAALAIVIVTVIDDPPAVRDAEQDTGLWVALVGAILLAVGAFLSQRRISIVITSAPREPQTGEYPIEPEYAGDEYAGDETETRPINPVGEESAEPPDRRRSDPGYPAD